MLIFPAGVEGTEPDRKSGPFALDWKLANLHLQLNEAQLRLALLGVGVGLLLLLLLVQCCCGCCCCGGGAPSADQQSKLHDLSNSSTLQDKQKLSLSAGHLHPVGGFAGQPFSAYHEYQMGSTHSYEKLAGPPEPPRKGSRSGRLHGGGGGGGGSNSGGTAGWPKEARYASVDPLYQSMARSGKEKPSYAGSAHGGYQQRPYSGGYYGGSSSGSMRYPEPPGSGSLSSLQPDFYFMPHQRRYSGEIVRVFVDYDNPI